MHQYTICEHSGLGVRAAEARAIPGSSGAHAVIGAGGVVVNGYLAAEAVAEAITRYEHGAIVPSSVAGSFSTTRLGGLRIWVPDLWGQAVVTLAASLHAVSDGAVLARSADAILAPVALL